MLGIGQVRLARARLATGVAATALAAGLSVTPASAQLVSTVPGVQTRITADPNGVDLVTGAFTLRHVDLSFGPNAKTRLNVETQLGSGDGDNYSGYVYERVESGINYVYAVRGSITKKFRVSNGTFSAVDGSGAILSQPTTNTYLLTESDGTQIEFFHSRYYSTGLYRGSGAIDYINYIQFVDGERLTFAMKTVWQQWCEGDEYASRSQPAAADLKPPLVMSDRDDAASGSVKASPTDGDDNVTEPGTGVADALPPSRQCYRQPWRRVQSITSNLGHQLRFAYKNEDTPPDDGSYNGFATVDSVMAVNLGVDYCDPAASTCATTRAWPKLTYTARSTVGQSGNTAYTDPLGRQWSVLTTYANGWPSQIEVRRPSSSTPYVVATLTGGANAKVSSVQTPAGTWNYNWSTAGAVVITDPLGRARTVVSDTGTGLITEDTNALGQKRRYTYDAFGRLVTATAPEGDSEEFQYDARGNITTRIRHAKPGSGLADITTTSVYQSACYTVAACNLPASSTDAKGNVTSFSWDQNHGGLIAVAAPTVGGVTATTNYSYMGLSPSVKDASGNMVGSGGAIIRLSRISACQTQASCAGTADEVVTTLTYGTNDRKLTQKTTGSGDGTLSRTTTMSYDDFGNMVSVDGPLPGADDTTVMRYDAAYRQVGVVAPDPDGAGPLARRAERTAYDVDDRVTSSESGLVNGTSDSDWAAFAVSQQSLATYNAQGFKTRDTIVAGGAVQAISGYGYDSMGRLICTAQRMDPSQWSGQTDYCAPQTSGPNGPDRVTQAAYDELGRVTAVQSAFGTPAAAIERQSFTANGQIAATTDANNNTTTYAYDGYDRLSATTFPGGSYEALGYDINDNVISRRLRDGQVLGYDYDARNRRVRDDNPGTGIGEFDATYEYDLIGRMTYAGDANGWFSRWEYDALGQMTRQSSNVSSNTLQYDAGGRMVRQTYGDGFFVTYDYNTAGWVTAVRENGGLALASYGYDGLGRRTSLTRGNGTVTSYAYDSSLRLTALTQDLGGTASDLTIGYSYNPAGQITTRSSSNPAYAFTNRYPVNRSYSVNGLNQYATAGNVSFTYDGRGNLTGDGSNTYGYNTRNELYTAQPGTLFYRSPVGLLNHVSANGAVTNLDYLGPNLMIESDGNGIQRRYVHGPGNDAPLVWYEGGQRRYLHADERGSIVAVTGDSGNTIAINTYDEFGIPGANNIGRFQYTGQKWIPELGIYDYKARMYSPTLGRFLQTDPIGYGDGLNWYDYGGGDPVNAIDPSGLVQQRFESCSSSGGGKYVNGDGDIVIIASTTTCVTQYFDLPDRREYFGATRGNIGGRGNVGAISPQNKQPTCPGNKSIFASIAEGADTVGNVADGIAIGSATLGLITAPTGAGGAFFGGTALVAGVVGRVASGVSIVANLADGNYGGAGAGAAGLVGGHVASRIVGGAATRAYARNRMFDNLSAGQQRRVDLFSDTGASAGSRVASRAVCR